MRFVVDASILIAVVVNEPEKSRLVEITKGVDLLAPASRRVPSKGANSVDFTRSSGRFLSRFRQIWQRVEEKLFMHQSRQNLKILRLIAFVSFVLTVCGHDAIFGGG